MESTWEGLLFLTGRETITLLVFPFLDPFSYK